MNLRKYYTFASFLNVPSVLRGSTAPYTAYIVYAVYIVYCLKAALHYLNSGGMYALMYC